MVLLEESKEVISDLNDVHYFDEGMNGPMHRRVFYRLFNTESRVVFGKNDSTSAAITYREFRKSSLTRSYIRRLDKNNI